MERDHTGTPPRRIDGCLPPAEFIDAALHYESTRERAELDRARVGGDLDFYGASIGAVRGTIRDVGLRHRSLLHREFTHDEITSLATELWAPPVFDRRLAAIVLLQTHLELLHHGDLTRLEGFLRRSVVRELQHPLIVDVVCPLIAEFTPSARRRADAVLARWAQDGDPGLALAAELART